MNRRGSYAKGVAKREEILTTALEVIAREGLRRTSIRELADAAGLSQAGLLHYFGSKEELYTAILRKRDEINAAQFTDLYRSRTAADSADSSERTDGAAVIATYLDLLRRGALVPGLSLLYTQLSVDAAAPEHPAHEFFLERRQVLRRVFVPAIAAMQAEGQIVDSVPAETLAAILHALSDGLQMHWLRDPDLDMAETVDALFFALAPRAKVES